MGSSWSASTSSVEIPRNENGKRLRPLSSSEVDPESSYRTAILNKQQEDEEPIIPRRAKRQRIQDYSPSLSNRSSTTTTSLQPTATATPNNNPPPFFMWAIYSISGKLLVLLAQAYMSMTEYSVATCKSDQQTEEIFQTVSDMLDDFQSLEPDILTRGWRILCACSLLTDTVNHELLLQALPDNDVATVVTGMRLHASSLRLQLLGCRALKILIDTNRTTWKQLVEVGFVPVMMNAMKAFPNDLVLQGLMMSFLGMVIKENHNVDSPSTSIAHALLEQGVVEVILAALEEFHLYTRLLHTGCLALLQMTASLQEARERIVQQNGHTLVYRILKEHLEDPLLSVVSLNTLSKLLCVQNMNGLPFEEVVPTVLECMKLYPEEESVQTHALVSILRLSERTQIPAEATLQLMIPAMTKFRHSRSFIFIACVVIRSLIANSTFPPSVLQLLLDTGGVECIANAAKDHESRSGIQQIVQLLLSVLLLHQHTSGVPVAFRGSLRVVGHMTSFEDFDSDNDDDL